MCDVYEQEELVRGNNIHLSLTINQRILHSIAIEIATRNELPTSESLKLWVPISFMGFYIGSLDVQYMISLYPVLCIQIDFMSKI